MLAYTEHEVLPLRSPSVFHAEYLLLMAGHCDVGDCARGDEPDTWYEAMSVLLAERAPA